MTTQTQALKLALEAIKNSHEYRIGNPAYEQVEAKIEEALAQPPLTENGMYRLGYHNGYGFGEAYAKEQMLKPEQEPVAWYHPEDDRTYFTAYPSKDMIENGYWQPLYEKGAL